MVRRCLLHSFGVLGLEIICTHNSFQMSVDDLVNAAGKGKIDEMIKLLNNGVVIDGFNTLGTSPLMYASYMGADASVEVLLAHGASVNLSRSSGYTALMIACEQNKISVISLLLKAGADHSLQNSVGNTALHLACCYPSVFELLLQHGADHTYVNEAGQTPVEKCRNRVTRAEIEASALLF